MNQQPAALNSPVEEGDDYAQTVLTYLNEKQFSLKDAGVSSRVYHHWRSLGLVPNVAVEHKRTALDFGQYLWLQMVKDLRAFGLPLTLIISTKQYLFHPNYLADILPENQHLVMEQLEEKEKRVFTQEEKATIYQQLRRGHVLAPSLFVALLLAHFHYRSPSNILIYLDGEVAVASAGLTEAFPATQPDVSRPHLTLPLAHYLTEFLSDGTKAEFLPKLPLLTPAEQEVLQALRNEQVKELTVKFSHKDGQRRMDLLTKVNKQEQLTKEQLQAIAKIVGLREYSTLTLKTQNGTQLTLEEEKRKRL